MFLYELYYVLLGSFIVSLVIVVLNLDFINNTILKFHKWLSKSLEKSESGFGTFFLSILKYPGDIPQNIKHDGWRSGLTFFTGTITISFTLALVGVGLFIMYYVIIAALIIGAVILVLKLIG